MSSESFNLKIKNLFFITAILLLLALVAWNAFNDYLSEEDASNSVNKQSGLTRMI